MPNDLITKGDGPTSGAAIPRLGSNPTDLTIVSFSIDISLGTVVDLSAVTP